MTITKSESGAKVIGTRDKKAGRNRKRRGKRPANEGRGEFEFLFRKADGENGERWEIGQEKEKKSKYTREKERESSRLKCTIENYDYVYAHNTQENDNNNDDDTTIKMTDGVEEKPRTSKSASQRRRGFVNAPLTTVLRFIHSSASAHRPPPPLRLPRGVEGVAFYTHAHTSHLRTHRAISARILCGLNVYL